jgi:hypothetical protein
VPTQTVFEFESTSARSTAVAPKPLAGKSSLLSSNVVSICDSPAFSRATESESWEPTRDGLGCARAIRAAFVLEGGFGLAIYAIWHFRHFITALHLIH